MKMFRKTKGAISIFLVMILVPMLSMSALFVDAAKVMLGKSVASSAGDLALNTALTNYDTMLKDIYGVFATAQNSDELYQKLEDYYRTSIMSSGLNEVAAQSYTDAIMSELGLFASENSASDILNMKLVDFEAKKMENANLANPALLKNQMVNFMKYRSPINTGLGFLTSLQSFSSLSEQTDLVEKRQKYYEAEKTVMGYLEAAWKNINAYNNLDSSALKYYTDMKTAVDGYQGKYKSMNKKTISDLYDTQDYVTFARSISAKNTTVNTPDSENPINVSVVFMNGYRNYTEYGNRSGDYNAKKLPTTKEIKSCINYFNSYVSLYYDKVDELVGKLENKSQYYDVQYLVQNNRGKLAEIDKAAQNVFYYYQKLKNARIWIDEYDNQEIKDSDGNVITAESIKNTKITSHNMTFTIAEWIGDAGESKDIDKEFNTLMNHYKPIAKAFSDISTTVRNSGKTNTTTVNNQVAAIAAQINGYTATLKDASGYLNDAITQLNNAKTAIQDGGELDTAKDNWSSAANSMDNTSMGRQDQAEIQQLGSYLNTKEIDKLIKRLQNVKTDIDSTVKLIEGYLFDGVYIGDIDSYNALKNTIGAHAGDNELKNLPLRYSEIETKAENWFQWTSGKLKVDWIDDSMHQPDLTKDKVNFYTYLYTHFGSTEKDGNGNTVTKKEDKAGGETLYNSIKDKSGSSAKGDAKVSSGNKVSGNNISGMAGLPSAGFTGAAAKMNNVNTGDNAASGTSDGLDGLFGGLLEAVANVGEDVRDNLYVSDYALSMFSYDTIENEYLKKNSDKTETDLKTLTLIPINSDNNLAYGSEVEYILYGDTNAKNVTYAYTTIYGIRLAFNLIYAFMTAEIRDTALALATPISAATLGVVPVPLIQAVIIIGLACCESGFDIADLKSGEAVPLFKTNTTWRASPSGLINYAKSGAKNALKSGAAVVVDATSQKLSEFLDMTDEQLNANIDTYKDQLAQHLGTAFDNTVGNAANSAIQKLTTLANEAIEQSYADASFNIEKYVSDGLDNWLASESGNSSDIAYIAKKEAVSIIKSQFIGVVVDALKDSKDTASGAVDSAAANLSSILGRVRSTITDQVTKVSGVIMEEKTKLINEVKDSMNQGADSLKNTLNGKIDGLFGDTGSATSAKEDKTSVATLFSFRYSDYLRLFLMIGLFTNPDALITRIADVIQVNMQKKEGYSDFSMFNAAAYVEITATVQVKPTLLALPLFADAVKSEEDDTIWYQFEYHDIRGY